MSYSGGGLNDPTSLAVDSTGKVWVANYNGVASLFTTGTGSVFAQGITQGGPQRVVRHRHRQQRQCVDYQLRQ